MFDTDQLIIVHYSQGCGGKFLINCLGLASNAVLQDKHLASLQLQGNLDTERKFKIILARLATTKNKWHDLGWGCEEYFGFNSDAYLTIVKGQLPFDPVVKLTVDHNNYFFLVSHDPVFLQKAIAVWPNANIVLVDNCNDFIARKRDSTQAQTRLIDYWNKIRDSNWSNTPPLTLAEMESLPSWMLVEITNKHNNELASYVYSVDYQAGINKIRSSLTNPVYHWDANWLLDENSTVQHLEELANNLGLDSVPNQYIRQYYQEYMITLDRIKQNG